MLAGCGSRGSRPNTRSLLLFTVVAAPTQIILTPPTTKPLLSMRMPLPATPPPPPPPPSKHRAQNYLLPGLLRNLHQSQQHPNQQHPNRPNTNSSSTSTSTSSSRNDQVLTVIPQSRIRLQCHPVRLMQSHPVRRSYHQTMRLRRICCSHAHGAPHPRNSCCCSRIWRRPQAPHKDSHHQMLIVCCKILGLPYKRQNDSDQCLTRMCRRTKIARRHSSLRGDADNVATKM